MLRATFLLVFASTTHGFAHHAISIRPTEQPVISNHIPAASVVNPAATRWFSPQQQRRCDLRCAAVASRVEPSHSPQQAFSGAPWRRLLLRMHKGHVHWKAVRQRECSQGQVRMMRHKVNGAMAARGVQMALTGRGAHGVSERCSLGAAGNAIAASRGHKSTFVA